MATGQERGARVTRTLDHQISRSVYVEDPDGNQHEFYADTLEDWRSIFNLEHDDVVTKPWNPEETEPSNVPLWAGNPTMHSVADAHFHADFITHAGLVAKDYEAMKAFFVNVAGLELKDENPARDQCLLRGPAAGLDLVLFAPREDVSPGLKFIAFVVATDEQLQSAHERAQRAGVTLENSVDRSDRRSITLRDPDGLHVVLYTRSPSSLGMDAGNEIMETVIAKP